MKKLVKLGRIATETKGSLLSPVPGADSNLTRYTCHTGQIYFKSNAGRTTAGCDQIV